MSLLFPLCLDSITPGVIFTKFHTLSATDRVPHNPDRN